MEKLSMQVMGLESTEIMRGTIGPSIERRLEQTLAVAQCFLTTNEATHDTSYTF